LEFVGVVRKYTPPPGFAAARARNVRRVAGFRVRGSSRSLPTRADLPTVRGERKPPGDPCIVPRPQDRKKPVGAVVEPREREDHLLADTRTSPGIETTDDPTWNLTSDKLREGDLENERAIGGPRRYSSYR